MSKYIEIYEKIKKDIIDGVFVQGEKLPSKRVCADRYGVSLITCEHAYELLLEEGYAKSVEKKGYYVSFDRNFGEYFESYRVDVPVNRENSEERDYEEFSFSVYARKVRKVLLNYQEEVMLKSPGFGVGQLRVAISEYLKKNRGIDCDFSQIIVGAGAEYLYGMIVKVLGRNLIYGIEDPSYEKIQAIYEAEGIEINRLPLQNDGIVSEKLWSTNAGVLHITPYRSYPSNISASASEKHEYIKWMKEKEGYIIEDDFGSEFSTLRKAEETIYELSGGSGVIYVNTFTKTIGSFVRIAYMVVPKDLIKDFERKLGMFNCTVPTLDQYVLSELINDGDFVRHINRVRRVKRNEGNI